MIRFLSDQDFNSRIVEALRTRVPEVDVLSVRDIGLAEAADPDILERAAHERRVLLTHDANTMIAVADQRLRAGTHHAGVVKVPQTMAIGPAVEDLVLIASTATAEDLDDQVLHLPL